MPHSRNLYIVTYNMKPHVAHFTQVVLYWSRSLGSRVDKHQIEDSILRRHLVV